MHERNTIETMLRVSRTEHYKTVPERASEKEVEDWMRKSVWRVGRTADDHDTYKRAVKAASKPSKQQRPQMDNRN